MKKHLQSVLVLFLMCAMCMSCSKDVMIEEDEATANSTLTVRTRAGDTDNGSSATVSYPVNIYVFNSKDACVAVQTLASESDEMSVKIPEGNYNVYAIAGADAENYTLPTKDNATKESVIALNTGKSHCDLMTAQGSVSLVDGEENKLTLSLTREVMLLETVSISNVPTNVTAVVVSISPIYENILLNGDLTGESGTQAVTLSKDGDTRTWKNNSGIYMLESIGLATVKVSFTSAKGTVSYSYTADESLQANYKISISGTYESDGVDLSGVLTGSEWAGSKTVNFTFGNSGSSSVDDGKSDQGTTDPVKTSAPEPGTMYNGCYVLKSETSGNSTVVTLVSAQQLNSLTFSADDDTSIKESINTGLSNLATDGIDGWRLPTVEEIKYVKENLTAIDAYMKAIGTSIVTYFYFTGKAYFTSDSDGNIKAYLANNGSFTTIKSADKSTFLRAFTTVTFTE